ncbi:transcriptional regulator [Methylobacillus sp. MM3]|uniref:BolA family protein n=1 Tax=Methylobacillus sp. MM3 TaxID=1848039 RepID=UPI0007E09962|nr:BolA family protein [Methylobacillus sp. MM3]OAJ71061.1 transcriptional regulator [Methylobacillus sp. MM3]
MNHSDLQDEIRRRLTALEPQLLEIVDDSAQHAGHAGNKGGGHFTLTVVSSHFSGKSQIMRHRIIYQALQELIPSRIHALSISAYAPEDR